MINNISGCFFVLQPYNIIVAICSRSLFRLVPVHGEGIDDLLHARMPDAALVRKSLFATEGLPFFPPHVYVYTHIYIYIYMTGFWQGVRVGCWGVGVGCVVLMGRREWRAGEREKLSILMTWHGRKGVTGGGSGVCVYVYICVFVCECIQERYRILCVRAFPPSANGVPSRYYVYCIIYMRVPCR